MAGQMAGEGCPQGGFLTFRFQEPGALWGEAEVSNAGGGRPGVPSSQSLGGPAPALLQDPHFIPPGGVLGRPLRACSSAGEEAWQVGPGGSGVWLRALAGLHPPHLSWRESSRSLEELCLPEELGKRLGCSQEGLAHAWGGRWPWTAPFGH